MPVKLYKLDPSPPARAAMMACEIFGVPAEMIDVHLMEKAHLTPEYLKKNPLHTVPVLEDGDIIITDSHAILQYLADKYGKDDTMYPKDVTQRALVNQKLFFNACILFPRIRNITYPLAFKGKKDVSPRKLDEITEAYGFLEEFLSRTKFLAGDSMTIADVAALPSVAGLYILRPFDPNQYPKTDAWLKTMQKQPFSKKHNEEGNKALANLIEKFKSGEMKTN